LKRALGPLICWKAASAALVTVALLAPPCCLQGQSLKVRRRAGSQHGFLALRNAAGAVIASGEVNAVPFGDRMKVRVVFRFRDGSLDDDTTFYSQRETLRLMSDRHVQRGPSFPKPSDVLIDMRRQQVSVRDLSKGDTAAKTEQMDLPPDLANGILFALLENLPPSAANIEVPFLSPGPKPRMVKLVIAQAGEEPFKAGGRTYKALKYDLKVNLGGLAGIVAPMIGKEPADTFVWISESGVPAILRIDGPLYAEGPVWSIQLASPVW
jgi:hypothetical protein